jgi:hypothetical protein
VCAERLQRARNFADYFAVHGLTQEEATEDYITGRFG